MTKGAIHGETLMHNPLTRVFGVMHGIVQRIDAWLWRWGIHHLEVRAILRVLVVLCAVTLFCGALASPFSLWPLWFAVGCIIFLNVFWGMARHLLRVTLTAYNFGLLAGVLLRSSGRMLFTAALLYVALIVCNAPAVPLVCGLIVATAAALATYALASQAGRY